MDLNLIAPGPTEPPDYPYDPDEDDGYNPDVRCQRCQDRGCRYCEYDGPDLEYPDDEASDRAADRYYAELGW